MSIRNDVISSLFHSLPTFPCVVYEIKDTSEGVRVCVVKVGRDNVVRRKEFAIAIPTEREDRKREGEERRWSRQCQALAEKFVEEIINSLRDLAAEEIRCIYEQSEQPEQSEAADAMPDG